MSIKEVKQLPKLPEPVQKLTTFQGFHDLFIAFYAESSTYDEAFNKANEEYRRLFGSYRYSDYDSFRVILRRKRRKRW